MNPFYDAVPFLSNESLINKLYSAAITWDLETDDGKNPDDEKLFTTLTMHGLNDIWTKYVFSKEKNENEFDSEAIEDSVQSWAIEN